MKIAVLSGKGGTGKTTVSTSLASSLEPCQYIDCDVEEPNGSIFLKPVLDKSFPVKVLVPKVDDEKCNYCGDCVKACQFNALAVLPNQLLIFNELCHSCGACLIVCKTDALCEVEREIGIIEYNEDYTFLHGKLNIGEPISIPIIKELKKKVRDDIPVILDCPPGASCSVVNSIEKCDYCIVVAEPTPFGLNDLDIVIKLLQIMDIPHGIVINKADEDKIINKFAQDKGIEILMEIPFSDEIARSYSKGVLPVENNDFWRRNFLSLYNKIARGFKI